MAGGQEGSVLAWVPLPHGQLLPNTQKSAGLPFVCTGCRVGSKQLI